ncbi:MAG: prolipoprotein diacylglyceryl transferase [Verrucomicrobiales bacterium]
MQPEAFTILGVTIYWYGVLAALGFLFGFGTAARRAPREGLSPETVSNLAPWLIGGTLVGARLFYVVTFWDEQFAGRPIWDVFMIRRSGLVFYGGLVGASLATILYCRLYKVPLWKLADVMSPSIALGHVFGRVGCVATGCCYGSPTSLPWALHYPKDHATHGIGVHPAPLYESGLNLILFFALVWLWKRKKFNGQIFAAYLLSYAVLRTITELFRGDYEKQNFTGLFTPGQVVSIFIFATGLFLWWKLPAYMPRKNASTASA